MANVLKFSVGIWSIGLLLILVLPQTLQEMVSEPCFGLMRGMGVGT